MKLPRVASILISLAATAPAVEAQTDRPGRADAEVTAGVRATRLRGATDLLLGGDVRLGVSGRVSLGGTGWVLLDPLTMPAESGASELLLQFGYGGAVVEGAVFAEDGRTVALRLTAGVGHAEVSLPGVGTEIAADNFGVVEPELTGSVELGGPLLVRAQIGYRLVFGVEDLPGVTSDHLRGASVSVGVTLRIR